MELRAEGARRKAQAREGEEARSKEPESRRLIPGPCVSTLAGMEHRIRSHG
jgi:hypothetical protein